MEMASRVRKRSTVGRRRSRRRVTGWEITATTPPYYAPRSCDLLIEDGAARQGELHEGQNGNQRQHRGRDGRGVRQLEELEGGLLDEKAGDVGGVTGTAVGEGQ